MNKEEILNRLEAIKAEERSLRAQLRAIEAKETKAPAKAATKTQANKESKFMRLANALMDSKRE